MSKYLEVVGAKTHNLKNISVKIPKNKMTVITGVSGSGKSSLAFNTIYNVGQQKYLESLSSYARMFIGGLDEEAEVDEINGLSPTISIDQKTTNKNPRSTVGTITEIYDYYKVLYLNIGDRKCIKCGNFVKKDSISDIINYILEFKNDSKFIIKSPLKKSYSNIETLKKDVLDMGFIRFSIGDEIYTINDEIKVKKFENIAIVIDRLVKKDFSLDDSPDTKRLKDSINLAYKIGIGQLEIRFLTGEKSIDKSFSNIFVCSNCGHIPADLSISSFSFNSHQGACPDCHGLGIKKVFLEERIVNPNLTLLEGAITGPGFGGDMFFELLKEFGKKNKIDLNKNYEKLTKREKDLIMYGTGDKLYSVNFKTESGQKRVFSMKFEGIMNVLTRRYYDGGADKGIYDEYIVDMDCPTCGGYRLNEESLSVYLNGLNIGQLSDLSVTKSLEFFRKIKLTKSQEKISKKALKNIIERLEFLAGVGLDYITISRKAGTISGGESQRIRLATQLGTKLEGIIYILDEPSIGLHPRDNDMLIENLKKLRDIGNTLIIVEHDEDIMRESDHIIDIGPGAGVHGGEIIAEGTIDDIINNPNSVTGPYLSGNQDIIIKRGKRKNYLDLRKDGKEIKIVGAKEHNLKNIDVSIPLENFVVVTGVSGSGKSSLVNDILANYLANELNRAKRSTGQFKEILGLENLDKTVIIDQSPIGRTPRSNPATYTGVFTAIREIFAMTEEAQIRGYGPGRFSFNTKEGRCDACEGDGVKKIEMHFLPTVYVECEVCEGKRYNPETLKVKYKGKTISDVLEMTIEEALEFFKAHPKVIKVLKVLDEVGLGYVKLGQSSTTLSGGESQRVKLATELSKKSTTKTFYILDEPTTGLHFQDVAKLLKILHSLVDKGNTVLVIEHNMDVILNADHIIDIGPDGGEKGGNLVYEGDINGIQKCKQSFTGQAVKKYLNKNKLGK
ncbi:excinuclease ABC subunit A [Candidatus Gracilibacteria bacterium GN02-872]|nr:excinuclease ABC subunit A [Candidatus Gracilibacteria bacterium GN02-872]